MNTRTHSERAIEAAFAAMAPCHERTSVVVLAMGIADAARRLLGDERAAELAYKIADELALKVKP